MDPTSRDAMRAAGRVSAIGIELAASIIGGLLLGYWGDLKLGTSPYLTLLGLVAGSFAGFRLLYATAKAVQKQAEEAERRERHGIHDEESPK